MLVADHGETFIAAFSVFMVFGAPTLLWFSIRYMKHRERMAMIARNQAFPEGPRAVGMPAGAPVDYAAPGTVRNSEGSPEMQVRRGIRTAFIGAAITIVFGFMSFHDGDFRPGATLLAGLVPLFIGLSQIVNGVLSGATFPGVSRPSDLPPYGCGAPPPGAGPGSPKTPGASPFEPYSYTYRPGGAPEIDVPPRPPQTRP